MAIRVGAANALPVHTTCRRILGCDDLFPLVGCRLPGDGHGPHGDVAVPAFSRLGALF